MQISHHPFLFGIIVLCAMVSAVSAAEVVVESDQLVVKGFDDSIGLGAFSIVLGYDPAKTTVTEIAFIEPFTGATNIQPDEKTARVSGFTVETGLTGDIPVARVVYEGEGQFDVYVNTCVNVRGDSVAVANPAYDGGSPVSPGTPATTAPTVAPTTGAPTPTTTQQPVTPQATGTALTGGVDTPALPQHQQTGALAPQGTTEPAETRAEVPGTLEQIPAARSPLPPALGIFAFAIVLFVLRRNP